MTNNVVEGYYDEGARKIVEIDQHVRFNNGISIIEGQIWQISQESFYSHTRTILIKGNDGKIHRISSKDLGGVELL